MLTKVIAILCIIQCSFAVDYIMENSCDQTLNMTGLNTNSLTIKLTNNAQYQLGLTCNLYIEATVGKKVIAVFEKLDLEPLNGMGNCQGDQVTFYSTKDLSFRNKIGDNACGLSAPSVSYKSTAQVMTIRVTTDNTMTGSGFTILATSYTDLPCGSGEFECSGICLSSVYQSHSAKGKLCSAGFMAQGNTLLVLLLGLLLAFRSL